MGLSGLSGEGGQLGPAFHVAQAGPETASDGRLTRPGFAPLNRHVRFQEEKLANQKRKIRIWKFIRIELKIQAISDQAFDVAFSGSIPLVTGNSAPRAGLLMCPGGAERCQRQLKIQVQNSSLLSKRHHVISIQHELRTPMEGTGPWCPPPAGC